MVDINDAVLAEYKNAGNKFQILVDCDSAMALKSGQDIDILDILAVQKIFSDQKKGQEASPVELNKVFGTDNTLEVAKTIIKKGDVHITAEYKNKIRDEKRKRITNIIQRNGVDPRTHAPHPLTRIEAAMDDAKVQIDEYKPAEEQVSTILKKLQPIIPIKFELKQIEVIVPGKYTGKTYPILKSFGKILKEEWKNDGSHMALIELPGGLEEEFLNKINSITHGDNEMNMIKTN